MVKTRLIRHIAREIQGNWTRSGSGTTLSVYARPYLEAMFSLGTIGEMYGADSARSIVAYFLANAQTWRGPVARRVKVELQELLKEDGHG